MKLDGNCSESQRDRSGIICLGLGRRCNLCTMDDDDDALIHQIDLIDLTNQEDRAKIAPETA